MLRYVRVRNDDELPDVSELKPYKALVIVEDDFDQDWQNSVSDWLVDTGCLYMMAWGRDCSSWDDAVDWANMNDFNFGDIPEDRFVMTTWHENDSLEEFFEFAKLYASHPVEILENILIVHVSATDREGEFRKLYEAVV